MLLTIRTNLQSALARGFEPRTTLEIDLAALTAEQRAAIAAIMDTTGAIRSELPEPTLAGLLEVAERQAAETRQRAAEVQLHAAKDAEREAAEAAARDAWLAARPTTEGNDFVGYGPYRVPYRKIEIERADGVGYTYYRDPRYEAWKAEVDAENSHRHAAAIAERDRLQAEALANRAATPVDQVIDAEAGTAFGLRIVRGLDKATARPVIEMVSDSGSKMRLRTECGAPKFERYLTIEIDADGVIVTSTMSLAGSDVETTSYPVTDGVISLSDSSWAAMVADPSAAKPVYEFLKRCPGGYEAPSFSIGDLLVWGGKDRKGRKVGPYDRLVYAVSDSKISVIKTDYATARKLRKLLIG